MKKSEYTIIRSKKDFLYQYFIREGGKASNANQFSTYMAFWTQGMGMHPQQGINNIVKFLDKKFA